MDFKSRDFVFNLNKSIYKIRVEGGLEVEDMYFLHNYNSWHEEFQITPVNYSFPIHHDKTPKLNVNIHMQTTKSKHKLFNHINPNGA